jgi:hypothetical protein
MLDRKEVPSRLPNHAATVPFEYALNILEVLEDEFGATLRNFHAAEDGVPLEIQIPVASIDMSRGG